MERSSDAPRNPPTKAVFHGLYDDGRKPEEWHGGREETGRGKLVQGVDATCIFSGR
jgi:hypothetical protein